MSDSPSVPCVEFPALPEIPDITLFGALKLTGFMDFSQGMSTQCSVTMSLMTQLAPMLASLTPLLKILAVLKALKATAESAFLDAGDLLVALGDLVPLFSALTPASIAVTIAGTLRLIIGFLNCFIAQLESAVKFQADLDLIQANIDANPELGGLVLTASLSCARANAALSMDQTMASLGPITPLLDMVKMIGGIADLSLDLSLDSSGANPADVISSLRQTIGNLEQVINSLPV